MWQESSATCALLCVILNVTLHVVHVNHNEITLCQIRGETGETRSALPDAAEHTHGAFRERQIESPGGAKEARPGNKRDNATDAVALSGTFQEERKVKNNLAANA